MMGIRQTSVLKMAVFGAVAAGLLLAPCAGAAKPKPGLEKPAATAATELPAVDFTPTGTLPQLTPVSDLMTPASLGTSPPPERLAPVTVEALQPAPDTSPEPLSEETPTGPPTVKGPVFDRMKNRLESRIRKTPEITYTALPAIAVFPVLHHGKEKAFGDLPLLFSAEFTSVLEKKAPGTRILNPVYTVEELRIRGMGGVYNRLMDYYVKAGRPEPKALRYLLGELSASGVPVHRVAFVEADVDFHHPDRSYVPADMLKAVLTDGIPKNQRYYVRSRVKVYNTRDPQHPLVWDFSWQNPVKADNMYNVTPSVYQDSDSIQAFGRASKWMSREMMVILPARVYLQGSDEISTEVAGQIVSPPNGNSPAAK